MSAARRSAAVVATFGLLAALSSGAGGLTFGGEKSSARSLRVSVTTAETGAPIRGAAIDVCSTNADDGAADSPVPPPGESAEAWRLSASSDSDGTAAVHFGRDGSWRVRVAAEGRATAIRTVPAAGEALAVALGAGHTLDGLVDAAPPSPTVASKGESVPSYVVLAGPLDFEGDERWAFARAAVEASGRFRLAGLPRGPVELWLVRGDLRPYFIGAVSLPGVTSIPVVRPPVATSHTSTDAAPSLWAPDGDITGDVEVRVTDTDDRPVAGATVWISDGFARRALGAIRSVTGRDGRATIPALSPGVAAAVSVSAPGFADAVVPGARFDAAIAGPRALTIRLDRRGPVRVSAVDAVTGKPVAGAIIWPGSEADAGGAAAREAPPRWNAGSRNVACGITGDAGVTVVHGLPVSGAPIQLDAVGYRPLRVWVAGDAASVVARLQPSLDIAGRAVRPDGAPVAGAWVWLHRVDAPRGVVSWLGPATTDRTGAFRFADVPERNWTLVSDASDEPDVASAAAGPYEAGRVDLRLELRERRTVRGIVRDESGHPVADAAVLCRADGRTTLGEDTPRTDSSGRFTSRDAPWGAFGTVVIADKVGPEGRQRRVVRAASADPGEADIVVTIGGGASIHGVLLDAAGSPSAGIPIIAVDAADPDADVAFGRLSAWNGCVTDSAGRFEIAGLAAVRHRLWLVWDWRDPPTSGGQAPAWLNTEVSPRVGILPGAEPVTLRIPGR